MSTQSSNLLSVQSPPKDAKDPDEAAEDEKDVPTDLVDIRKRAHSLGSRSWIKSATLRKLTNKLHGVTSRKAAAEQVTATNTESAEDERSRAGSTGSQTR